ncbi:MAG: integrase arm-type DNA-binding domain-containing protein [Alphaproteobacteria bacterium]
MPKLTKKYVNQVKPKNKGAVYWDNDLKGFGLRVKPSGHKVYILQYRNLEGRSRKYTIGKHGSPWTPDEARKKAKSVLHSMDGGGDPESDKTEARQALTVSELCDLYVQDGPNYKPDKKESTWTTDKSNIERHIKPLLGQRKANALKQADVARFQADVANGKSKMYLKTKPRGAARVIGGKGTAARSLGVLGAMYEFGKRCGYVDHNPARAKAKF